MSTTESIPSIPRKLLKNSIFNRRIRVNPSLFLNILIDNNGKLFEICDGSVLNVCSLQKFNPKTEPEFQLYFTYQQLERNVFYLIKFEQYLNILHRTNDGLKNIKTFENVQEVNVHDHFGTGFAQVEIKFQDEMSLIFTDFNNDNEIKDPEIKTHSFDIVLKKAQEMAYESRSKCREAVETYAGLYQTVCDELKFAPSHLRSENQLEKVILVPYANIWKRTHNGKLILGLPILNTTYQRPLVASNIKATLFCESLTDFEFQTCLYKCVDDYHSIDELKCKLESFVETEAENAPNLNKRPKFHQEWTVIENGNLHGEESGIVIVIMDLKSLIHASINNLNETLKFRCFINYHVNDAENVQYDLQLFFGEIEIRQKELLSTEYWVTFENEALIDLLAVTTTSLHVQLSFEYSIFPSTETLIKDFLKQHLGFVNIFEKTIETPPPEPLESISIGSHVLRNWLLYQNEGFLKGMVVRIEKSSSMTFKVKIYGANESQIISLVKTFVTEFDEGCRISMADETFEKEKLVLDLKYSLLEELSHLKGIDNQNNGLNDVLEAQTAKEAISDSIYRDILSFQASNETNINDVKE